MNSSVQEGQDNCRAHSSAMCQTQKNLPEPGWDRGWERMDTCVCMVESLCYSTKTTTTLLTGYIPTQSKNFKIKINLKKKNLPENSQDYIHIARNDIDLAKTSSTTFN